MAQRVTMRRHLYKEEWCEALRHGDLISLQQGDSKDPVIFSPANNTEYLNAATYLEAFWGYIWPALCHRQRATARALVSTKAWRIEGVRRPSYQRNRKSANQASN